MILVDSSVWIDALAGRDTIATGKLRRLIRTPLPLVADLVIVEVLRGMATEDRAELVLADFARYRTVTVGGADIAVVAARHYRHLRRQGITVRSTIDLMLATWCVANDASLLHSDRDFDLMAPHLGLKVH